MAFPVLLGGAAACVAVAVGSGFAERRRRMRHDLDRVGVVAWPTVQLLAICIAFLLISLALNSR